jgi:hypothetical protein
VESEMWRHNKHSQRESKAQTAAHGTDLQVVLNEHFAI